MFGIYKRWPHFFEFEDHLDNHILNRTGSLKWSEVKHVLVIGSSMPWIEAMLLEKGVTRITSLVPDPENTKTTNSSITIISHSDLSKMWSEGSVIKFGVLISVVINIYII